MNIIKANKEDLDTIVKFKIKMFEDANLIHLLEDDSFSFILSKYKKVLIPEVNTGQFRKIIRSEFLVDAVGLNEVRGKPLSPASIIDKAKELINE